MSRYALCGLLFAGWLIVLSPFGVRAQSAAQEGDSPQIERPKRPNLLQQLNLSPDQIQQIRSFNKERRATMQESQRRLKDANQALDEAINSSAGEPEIQARQKEVQAAHTDFVKNRTINEQFVRQVLTPEQFEKFRGLQADFRQNKKLNNLNRNQANGVNNIRNKDTANKDNDKKDVPSKINEMQKSDKSLTPRRQRQLNRQERQVNRRSP